MLTEKLREARYFEGIVAAGASVEVFSEGIPK